MSNEAIKIMAKPQLPWYKAFLRSVVKYKYMYLMLIPGLVYILVFNYAPIYGLTMAFQDFKITKGFFNSPFVGFDNFKYLFGQRAFQYALRNTIIISFYKIIFGFPIPIILALLINEVKINIFKRSVQTILYMPHFLSWIIMFGLIYNLIKEFGPVDSLIKAFGGQTIHFLSDISYFRGLVVASDIWKEMGWSAIIYLAALAGVPPELYESAVIDGASRFKCIIKISLPVIMPTITIMFLLRIGGILNAGFEQIFTMYNSAVFRVGDIIDTYVYRIAMVDSKFHISAAAGFFKSVIGCFMILGTNALMNRFEQETLF